MVEAIEEPGAGSLVPDEAAWLACAEGTQGGKEPDGLKKVGFALAIAPDKKNPLALKAQGYLLNVSEILGIQLEEAHERFEMP